MSQQNLINKFDNRYVHKIYISITILILIPLFTACVPKFIIKEPTVIGKIVDADTNKTIANAKIFSGNNVAYSNDKGEFYLEATKELGIGTITGGIYFINREYTIEKDGYETVISFCEALTIEFCEMEISLEKNKI